MCKQALELDMSEKPRANFLYRNAAHVFKLEMPNSGLVANQLSPEVDRSATIHIRTGFSASNLRITYGQKMPHG